MASNIPNVWIIFNPRFIPCRSRHIGHLLSHRSRLRDRFEEEKISLILVKGNIKIITQIIKLKTNPYCPITRIQSLKVQLSKIFPHGRTLITLN